MGEELIPLGKVKDFSPYISKIKATGAQALITGNWGPDLNLMMKAGVDAGFDVDYYTYLAHVVGGVTAVGATGENRLYTVTEFHPNAPVEQKSVEGERFVTEWRKSHDFDLFQMNNYILLTMLAKAINKVGSTDAYKVALALEDITAKDPLGHDYRMRKEDHQLLEPLYATKLTKDVKYDSEKTGLGWKTITLVEGKDLDQPTTCKMKRPAS